MHQFSLTELSKQLESKNSKDRLLALAHLREVEPEDAVPLIKKGVTRFLFFIISALKPFKFCTLFAVFYHRTI